MVSLSVTYGVTLLLASAAAIGAAFAGNYMYAIGAKEEPAPEPVQEPISVQEEIQPQEPSVQSTEQTLPEVVEATQ